MVGIADRSSLPLSGVCTTPMGEMPVTLAASGFGDRAVEVDQHAVVHFVQSGLMLPAQAEVQVSLALTRKSS